MKMMRPGFMRGQKGFTLVEIIIVLAILAVVAAIAVPQVTGYVSRGKERSYDADKATIQAAVDAYYSDPGNTKFLGKRQYPILGRAKTGGTFYTNGAGTGTITITGNPLGGTIGGAPVWADGPTGALSGLRESVENILRGPGGVAAGPLPAAGYWQTDDVDRSGTTYYVDSRDYLIDFKLLVDEGFLKEAPDSASLDNGAPTGVTLSGHYSWYVDASGNVESLYYDYPVATNTDFISGVYP